MDSTPKHPVRKAVQAKHVPADAIVAFITAQPPHHLTSRWMIEDALPQFPSKVVLAKLRRLVNNGTLDGCACGCGGGFQVLRHAD